MKYYYQNWNIMVSEATQMNSLVHILQTDVNTHL